MQQPISSLMIQANFGRRSLSETGLMVANNYRFTLAGLVVVLIGCHALLVEEWWLLLLTLGAYALYLGIKFTVFARAERWFYTPRVQFWRARLAVTGPIGVLLILFLPAILVVSRYCGRQTLYALTALEIAVITAGLRLLELPSGLPLPVLLGAMGAWGTAVVLSSFLVHYLARVIVTTQGGAALRDQVITRRCARSPAFLCSLAALSSACCRSISASATSSARTRSAPLPSSHKLLRR